MQQRAALGAEQQVAVFDQPVRSLLSCPAALVHKSSISFAGCVAGEWLVSGHGWCGTLDVVTLDARVEHVGSLLRPGEARSVVDAERLALSPQCGFATSVGGNAVTARAQRAKLALLVRAARDFLPASTGT